MSRWNAGRRYLVFVVGLFLLVAATAPATAAPRPGDLAVLGAGAAGLEWSPLGSNEGLVLTVTGPDGLSLRREFRAGESPSLSLFDDAGQALPEGDYNWDLRSTTKLDAQTRRRLAAARRAGDDAAEQALRAGHLSEGAAQSGTFRVVQGAFVTPEEVEERVAPPDTNPGSEPPRKAAELVAADQVIPDDLIVQGSICAGFDCVNGESFGFDTIRMKENNTRIKFEDTSVGTFPSTDWQLTANDSASGGQNKFSIEDVTSARVPFTVEGGALTNSVYVDSTGKVGFRTSTPVLDLHVNTSNTPGIRLEQNNAGGFSARTWDVAGNEANFFVRDVTGGSLLPFRIRPGAPTSSIDINSSGEVGIGTASPTQELTVKSDAGNSNIVEVLGSSASNTVLYRFFETTSGDGLFSVFDNTGAEAVRFTAVAGGRMAIGCNSPEHDLDLGNASGTACNAVGSRSFIDAGSTAFTASSSRTLKENIVPVAVPDILQRIADVGVYSYDFVSGAKEKVGLMAEDFHRVFERGSDKLINGQDVEMALWLAVQELAQRNAQLTTTNDQLLQRLERLEALVSTVAVQP